MPYPAKTLYATGLLATNEGTYNGGGSVAAGTDGQRLAYDGPQGAPITYTEDYDGTRHDHLVGSNPPIPLTPSKTVCTGDLPGQVAGAGSAYSSGSVVPSHFPLLKASGLTFSLAAGTWTGIPTPFGTAPSSLVGGFYAAGELWPFQAGFCQWKFAFQKGEPIVHTFGLTALMGTPSDDVTVPQTITYPAIDPPKADGITFTIGGIALDVLSGEFALGWDDHSPRQVVTVAGAHAGWARGVRVKPRFKVTVERTALATYDPYADRRNATGRTLLSTFGTSATNRYKVNSAASRAYLVSPVKPGNNGSVATWELEFGLSATSLITNDAVSVLFD